MGTLEASDYVAIGELSLFTGTISDNRCGNNTMAEVTTPFTK